jgi:hypothetical protein
VRLVPLSLAQVAGQPQAYAGTFKAPAGGELVLFANDAVALFDADGFYDNNAGTAFVSLTPRDGAAETGQAQKRIEVK